MLGFNLIETQWRETQASHPAVGRILKWQTSASGRTYVSMCNILCCILSSSYCFYIPIGCRHNFDWLCLDLLLVHMYVGRCNLWNGGVLSFFTYVPSQVKCSDRLQYARCHHHQCRKLVRWSRKVISETLHIPCYPYIDSTVVLFMQGMALVVCML